MRLRRPTASHMVPTPAVVAVGLLLALALAGCDRFTLATMVGEARHGGPEPIKLQLTAVADYPITADTPVIIAIRPEFVLLRDALILRAESEGTYLVYDEELADQRLLTDEGYIVALLYDSNDDFENDGRQPDEEDIVGVYDEDQAMLRSDGDGLYTPIFRSTVNEIITVNEIVVDFPSAPTDADEPANDDPTTQRTWARPNRLPPLGEPCMMSRTSIGSGSRHPPRARIALKLSAPAERAPSTPR